MLALLIEPGQKWLRIFCDPAGSNVCQGQRSENQALGAQNATLGTEGVHFPVFSKNIAYKSKQPNIIIDPTENQLIGYPEFEGCDIMYKMAREAEIEIQVKSLTPTRNKLQKLGKLIKKLKSNDFIFNDKFLDKDIVLRLRNIRTQFPKSVKEALITFKTPREATGIFQSRQEIEFKADNFQKAFNLFKELYGKPAVQFTWIGEKYEYKNCGIWLKDTIGIIKFIEIEGPGQKQIEKVQQELEIKGKPLKIGALEYVKRKLRKNV